MYGRVMLCRNKKLKWVSIALLSSYLISMKRVAKVVTEDQESLVLPSGQASTNIHSLEKFSS